MADDVTGPARPPAIGLALSGGGHEQSRFISGVCAHFMTSASSHRSR